MKKIILLSVSIALFAACSNKIETGNYDNSDVNVPTANKSVDQLLGDASNSLEKDEWDEAIAYYNAAYNKDNDDARAIIYSTLANLAKISTDPKVAALIKNNFGFTDYPSKLNALFSDSWMKDTPSLEFDYYDQASGRWVDWYRKGERNRCNDEPVNANGYYYCNWQNGNYNFVLVSSTPKLNKERLPGIRTPNWLKGSGSLYDSYLINGAFSVDNWALSIIANILDRNSNGFNGLLDEVIDGVFGASYNEAVDRLKKLENKKEERIKLDPYFIEKFGLEEIFDEYDKIGWAEVNAVLSAMLAVKASLEWVQTYDLNIDLNWLKFAWSENEDKFEQDFFDKFKSLAPNQLPFNNNFLKIRSDKSMATPKATYVAAIRGLQASYASIQNSELYPSEVKNAYPAINDGFEKLISAINSGGKFYIPKEDPTKINAWPATSSNAQATVDLGKLFTPGYFSLQNIFETDNGKPVFYLEREICDEYYWDCYYNYVKLDKNNYAAKIYEGGRLSLKLNTNKITAIADKIPEDEIEYAELGFNQEHAKIIFEKYYK
jgi:hypothetical protein